MRYWAALSVLTTLIAALPQMAVAQVSGTIDFSDSAPPPTEAEKTQAKATADRAMDLASKIQTIATAMRATFLLREAVEKVFGGSLRSDMQAMADDRNKAFAAAIVAPAPNGSQAWLIDSENLKEFVRQSVRLTSAMQRESLGGVGALGTDIKTQLDRLSLVFDTMVAEHGILNANLRYYPLSTLYQQVPVSCETINRYSRDFKCLPGTLVLAPDTSGWVMAPAYSRSDYCEATNAQNFPVADWPAFLTLVRKASFADHVLPGELEGAVVPSPHSEKAIGAAC